jgi:hypothetical protein
VLPQASYSPNLSHCDFYIFSKLNSGVKGYYFQTLGNFQKAVTDAIKRLKEAFSSALKRGKFAEPSVLHQRDVILKGTALI